MIHPVHLVAAAIARPPLPAEPVEAVCAVTGAVGPCIPRRLVVPDSNCDQFLFAAPHSEFVHVDVHAAWYFGELKEGRKRQTCPERQASWWCDGREFRILATKAEIVQILLDGSPSAPWAMWITRTKKKHGSVRTRTNTGLYGQVGFEDLVVDASDPEKVSAWWATLRAAQDAGIWRSVMQTLDCPVHVMRKIGPGVWLDFEAWARTRCRSRLYALLTYLLPNKEALAS